MTDDEKETEAAEEYCNDCGVLVEGYHGPCELDDYEDESE